MRAKVYGTVQQVDLAMFDGKPIVSKDGKPVHQLYLLQNGAGQAPEILKCKFYGSTPPKVGDKYEAVAHISLWKNEKGAAGLSANIYS